MQNLFRKPPQIGIWGMTGAGKSTYFASVLLQLLLQREVNPSPIDDISREFWSEESGNLTAGRFPQPTDPALEPTKLSFEISIPKVQRKMTLTLIDASGEHIFDPNDTRGYFKTLASCTGILLILDAQAYLEAKGTDLDAPSDKKQNYFKPLVNLISKLKANGNKTNAAGRLTTSIALCANKCDIGGLHKHVSQPKALVRNILGVASTKLVESGCDQICYFATSSVGRVRVRNVDGSWGDEPNLELRVAPDGTMRTTIKDIDNWQPINLLDPLFWCIDPHKYPCSSSG